MSEYEGESWSCSNCGYHWNTMAGDVPTCCPKCGFVENEEENGIFIGCEFTAG